MHKVVDDDDGKYVNCKPGYPVVIILWLVFFLIWNKKTGT